MNLKHLIVFCAVATVTALVGNALPVFADVSGYGQKCVGAHEGPVQFSGDTCTNSATGCDAGACSGNSWTNAEPGECVTVSPPTNKICGTGAKTNVEIHKYANSCNHDCTACEGTSLGISDDAEDVDNCKY